MLAGLAKRGAPGVPVLGVATPDDIVPPSSEVRIVMDAVPVPGEVLAVPERVIVAPAVGVFRPLADAPTWI